MTMLAKDIAAFDGMREELEANHKGEWVVFHHGEFAGFYPDFQAAAFSAVERFDEGPYLIREVGALPIQLPGGMVFTPSHVLGTGRI